MYSNSSWVDGTLEVELHEFFDLMLSLVESASHNENETVDNGLVTIKSVQWRRSLDAIRKSGVANPIRLS